MCLLCPDFSNLFINSDGYSLKNVLHQNKKIIIFSSEDKI